MGLYIQWGDDTQITGTRIVYGSSEINREWIEPKKKFVRTIPKKYRVFQLNKKKKI